MQIEASKLIAFTEKATLSCSIPNFLILIKDSKISAITRNPSNAVLTSIEMKITAPDELKLPIKDTRVLLAALKLFDGKIEIIRDNNILSIYNANRQVDITLAEESYIECNLSEMPSKLVWEASVDVDIKVFMNALKNSSVSNSDGATVELDKKNLIITTGEKNFDKVKETIPASYPEAVKAKFANFIFDVAKVIGDKVTLSVKTNYPIKLEEKTTDLKAIYVIAPLVDNE